MRLAALISGGKDSLLALHKAAEENEIACLISVFSENVDSFMFHTANVNLVDAIALSMQKPLYKVFVSGKEELEVYELEKQLSILKIDGIVIGGIRSEYQRKRFKRIAENLGIELIAPLWHVDEMEILREVKEKFDAIIVKVSAMGLDESFIGRRIDDKLIEELIELNRKYKINLAGEGGEFETLVLDAPLYTKKIVIRDFEIIKDAMSATMIIKSFELRDKGFKD